MKRNVIIFFHAGYWLAYLFFTLSSLIIAGSNFMGNVYSSAGLNTFLAVSCFYTFYFVLVPKYLSHQKIKKFIAMGLLTAFITAIAMVSIRLFGMGLGEPRLETENPTDFFPIILQWTMVVVFHTLIGSVHGLLGTFMKGFFSWYDDIYVKQQLEKKNLETQMALLKARIDPHFLFNTLNNIDTLIKSDPSVASIYLQKLCNIMRFTLYENHAEVLPLQREVEVMKEYIALERLRCSADFISVEIVGALGEIRIAPMVLLTFVENAIKHSDGQKIENAVIVKITAGNDSQVEFFCRNIISKRQRKAKGGIGIDLIKNRLNLLYPNKHDLLLTEKDGYFEVKLTIITK